MGRARGIVADSSVLINLCHLDRLDLLVQHPSFDAHVTRLVLAEVTRDDQQRKIQACIKQGQLLTAELVTPAELVELAKHNVRFGAGEASCFATAILRGWSIACDESGAFRKAAHRRLGQRRYVGTIDLILHAIKTGQLSVQQADAYKATLAANRFGVSFGSFADLL